MRYARNALTMMCATALAATAGTALADHKKHKRSGTHVSAPYTKVDVDKTVRVKAPFTKVKVGKRRVKVRAPYVNLDINW